MKAHTLPAPACPDHPRGHTWHDGYYGKCGERGYFQHPRFRCRPRPGHLETHGFTNHRRVATHGHSYCEFCDRARDGSEGPRSPNHFQFAVPEIATSLYELSAGSSYRGTAKLRRREIDRPARRRNLDDEERFSNQGHLVQDWLEEFGPIVLDGKLATSWPRIMVLDDKGYVPALSRRGGRFRICAALDAGSHQLVRMAFYPGYASRNWWDFLSLLPGQPEVVVTDDSRSIGAIVQAMWPDTRIWSSHWHLRRQLANEHAPRRRLIPPGHWLLGALDDAFRCEDNWWSFIDACMTELSDHEALQRWIVVKADLVANQIAESDFLPRSTGGVEDKLRKVDARIGERRGFANKERTDLLLALWTIHLNHRAHLDEFTRKIRVHLESNGGRAPQRSRIGGRRAVTGTGHEDCLCHPRIRRRWG